MPLEWVQYLVYCAWAACGPPHVSRSWVLRDVGYIQNTQERFFFQAFLRGISRSIGYHPSRLSLLGIARREARPLSIRSHWSRTIHGPTGCLLPILCRAQRFSPSYEATDPLCLSFLRHANHQRGYRGCVR